MCLPTAHGRAAWGGTCITQRQMQHMEADAAHELWCIRHVKPPLLRPAAPAPLDPLIAAAATTHATLAVASASTCACAHSSNMTCTQALARSATAATPHALPRAERGGRREQIPWIGLRRAALMPPATLPATKFAMAPCPVDHATPARQEQGGVHGPPHAAPSHAQRRRTPSAV